MPLPLFSFYAGLYIASQIVPPGAFPSNAFTSGMRESIPHRHPIAVWYMPHKNAPKTRVLPALPPDPLSSLCSQKKTSPSLAAGFRNLCKGTAIATSRERLRTVANGGTTSNETHFQLPGPQSETGTLATHSGKTSKQNPCTLALVWSTVPVASLVPQDFPDKAFSAESAGPALATCGSRRE